MPNQAVESLSPIQKSSPLEKPIEKHVDTFNEMLNVCEKSPLLNQSLFEYKKGIIKSISELKDIGSPEQRYDMWSGSIDRSKTKLDTLCAEATHEMLKMNHK